MSMLNGEEVAKKIYNGLFHQMADIQIDQLMGKWYVVSITEIVGILKNVKLKKRIFYKYTNSATT